MKISVQSIDNIGALLAELGTDYFDLLLYHYPFPMCDSKAQLKQACKTMNGLKQWWRVKRIGVSYFYASHLTKLFDVCQEFNLEKPFANEIQINPYVYCLEKDALDLCFQNNLQLIAYYSPLGFNTACIVLQNTGMQSIVEEIGIATAQFSLHGYFQRESASFPKATTYYGRKKTLLPRTLSKISCTFLMTWTRSQKVKIPASFYSIMLKNPRKTPTGCACWSIISMISILDLLLASLHSFL